MKRASLSTLTGNSLIYAISCPRRQIGDWMLSCVKTMGLALLSFSVALLLPDGAKAASFSPDSFSPDNRATIALFRGAGNLLGSSGPSGVDSLANRIDSAFPDDLLSVQVFDSYDGNIFNFQEVGSSQVSTLVNSVPNAGALGLIGYSAGGVSAIKTAKNNSQKTFDLVVQVESYDPLTGRSQKDEVLPENVQTGINYYQRQNRFNVFKPGWDLTDLQGATNVSGSQNINAESLFGDRSITHRNIINDSRLQEEIVQDIQANIIDTLLSKTPASLVLANDLAADAAANELVGSIDESVLTLLEPTDSEASLATLSSQSNQPSSRSVPEPNAVLTLGLLGCGLWFTRRLSKNSLRSSATVRLTATLSS